MAEFVLTVDPFDFIDGLANGSLGDGFDLAESDIFCLTELLIN